MAKRFTDTNKWKKPFIRSLELPYKLFWFYILDDCDHAGIWEVDIEVAEIRTGCKIDEKKALQFFGERVLVINKNKWFFPDFIEFQYGELNPANRLHKSVLDLLSKYLNKDLIRSLQGPKDKDKDKDKEKDKEKEQGQENPLNENELKNLLIPKMFSLFKTHNPTYLGSVEHDYKPLMSIARFLAGQGNIDPIKDKEQIFEVWELLSEKISKDNFYCQKTLLTISNHIQSIAQTSVHGKKQKLGTSAARTEAIRNW